MAHLDDAQTRRANSAFIKSSMRTPLLERDRELALARRWREHGDQSALHALTTAHTRLVVAIAAQFRRYGLPTGDLIQEGNLGLMEAAARFEADRDVRFSTYAAWWIRARVQDFVLRNWSIVRTGTSSAQKMLFFNLRRLRARLDDGAGDGLSQDRLARIAASLNVRLADVVEMEGRLSGGDQSLNMVGEEGGEAWQDRIPDPGPGPEDLAQASHDAPLRVKWLTQAIAELSPRERQIVRRRQLDPDGDMSLAQLGKQLGVSAERVRQIEQRALAKLRAALLRCGHDATDMLPA